MGPVTEQPTVVALEWLSEEAGEAALTITDRKISCLAFCHPCRLAVGDALRQPLLTLDVRGIERARSDEEPSLTRTDSAWGHSVIAKVINRRANLVAVGGFTIELDQSLPGDIQEGDFIGFACARLDAVG
jgi:hypothetical protein